MIQNSSNNLYGGHGHVFTIVMQVDEAVRVAALGHSKRINHVS
jgi:hypothetical protein